MPGLDEVLERLVNEGDFREELTADPKRALAGYDLTPDDLDLLATQLSAGVGGLGSVEQRTTKAGLFGLFTSMFSGGGGGGGMVAELNSDTLPDGDDAGIWVQDTDPDLGGDAEVSEAVLLEQPPDTGDPDPGVDGTVVPPPDGSDDGGPGGDLDSVMEKPPKEEGYGDVGPGNPDPHHAGFVPPPDGSDDGGPGGDLDALMEKPPKEEGYGDLGSLGSAVMGEPPPDVGPDALGGDVGLNFAEPGGDVGLNFAEPEVPTDSFEPGDGGGIELLGDEVEGPSPHM